MLSKNIKYRNLIKVGSYYLLLIPLLFTVISSISFSQNTWTAKANFGGGIRSGAVGFSINDKAYIGTGGDGGTNKKDLWEYDPSNNSWTQKADVPGLVRVSAIAFSINGKGYLGLGEGIGYFNDFHEYDPVGNSWTTKASFIGSARQGSFAFATSSKGYVGCGFNGAYLNTFYEYNPITDTWTQLANYPGSARYVMSAFSISDFGYAGIGRDGGSYFTELYQFNPQNGTWTSKANFTGPARAYASSFSINGKGYFGLGYDGSIVYQDIYEYDPFLNTWSAKTSFTGSARYYSTGIGLGNYGYFGTGFDGARLQDFYQYTPGTTPSPNTTIISSITTTTATSGGTISTDGNYSITAKGVVWGTSANPTVALATKTNDGTGTGSFTSSITGLTPGTQYYYRAYATNSQGTSYGTEYTFTTTQTGGTWARQTDFPLSGREGASGFEYNNIGYVANGTNGTFQKDVWSYNPNSCQWTQKGDFSSVARYHSGAVTLNSKSYILGGYDINNNYMQDFWEYNPATDVWTQKTNIPSGSRFKPAIFSIGSYIYAGIGAKGSGTPNYQNDFYQYDPVGNTWTAKTNFGGTARLGCAYFATTTKGYIGLGYDNTSSYKNDFWEYDPVANTWTQKANYTGNSRDMAKGFCINEKGYVISGIQSNGSSYTTDNYEYDPIANTWTARTSFTGSARYAATGFVLNNTLYLGMGYDGSYKADFYSYLPNSEPTITTTAITSISTTSASSGGNVLGDGGTSVTARGLVWSASVNPPTTSTYDGITTNGTGTGAFTQTINALCPGTTYYVRAYATNTSGTSYGTTQTFTTTTSPGDIWVQKANFGGTARNATVAFSIGTKGYIGTGNDISSASSDFWEYDIYSNVWTQKANYGGGSVRASSGFALGGKGYLGCGFDGGYRNDFWEYNPSTNVWTSKASFSGTARYNIMAAATSTRGYFIGGTNSTPTNVNEVWEYNPGTNTWTSKANFGGGVRRLGGVFVVNDNIYIAGGHSTASTVHNDLYVFNPTLNMWTQKASFGGTARNNLFGFSISNKGYIGLGTNEAGTIRYSDIWEYDITQDIWIQKGNFIGTTRSISNTNFFSIGNKGYIGTGYDGTNLLQDFYEYTPNTIPQFISGSAGSITSSGAAISATYDANYNGCSSDAITDHGLVWHTATAPTTTTNSGTMSAGAGTSTISHTITGLSPATTYYVRSYSASAQGTRYGNEVSFTTSVGLPTVSTTAVTNISTTTAQSGGNVTSEGGAATVAGLVWSASNNTPTISTNEGISTNIGGIGTYSPYLHALCPGTTYYVRAWATNSQGTSYGTTQTFTTTTSPGDIWVQKTNFGGVARRNAFSFSLNNLIYFGGGTNGTVQQDFWEFDSYQDVWTQRANYGGGPRFDGKGFTIGNKGYVTSGGDGTTNYNDLWEYDRTNNTWTAKANHGGTGRWGGVAFSIGTKGYFGTGALLVQDFWEWDSGTNTWVQKANFPIGTRNAVGFSIGSYGYIGTGVISGSTENHFYQYNPATNTWVQKADYGGGIRENATGFSIGNKGFIVTGDDGVLKKDMWEYDPTYDVWSKKSDFAGTARRQSTSTSNGTKAYLGLGLDGANKNDFYEYTPSTVPSFLITTAVSSITSSGGIVSAVTDPNFTACSTNSITSKGIILGTSNSFTISNASFTFTNGSGNSNFSTTLSGLSPATTYYARAFSTSAAGSNYGNATSFTTLANAPTVATTAITSIATTSASSGGNVTSDGGDAVTGRGLVWSASVNPPTISSYDGITSNSSGTGTFTQTINALCPGTTYYVRAYATNSIGTSYGATQTFTTTASAGDIWVQKTSFPNGARYQNCNLSIGNKVYVGMGTTGFVNYDDLWEYDTDEDTWTQVASFPNGLITGTINFSINGKGYACGGVIGGSWQHTVFEYNPTLNTWTQKNNLPFSGPFRNRSNGLGLANSTRGFIIGGFDCSTGRAYTELIEYNPNTDSWVQRPDFHTRNSSKPSGFVVDENLYVYATGNCLSAMENSFFCYNTSTNSWSNKATFPGTASVRGIGFAIGKKGYIGTGREQSLAVSDNMFEYDVTNDLWKKLSNVPTSGTEHASCIVNREKAYYGLGASIGVNWYEYTPSTVPSFYITSAVSSITSSGGIVSAVTDANFNGCATNSITNKGIILGKSNSFTLSNASFTFTSGSGNSNFSTTLSGLSPATAYFVRAFSTSSVGSNYGNAVSFTTLADLPTITTTAITSIATTSASSGGNVTSDGGDAVTARGLVWSTSVNPPTISSNDGITSNSSGTGTFTQTINALCPGTTYYVRAYATNSIGTSYGATQTFTATASAGDIWVQKTNFGGGGRDVAATFVINNNIYISTGRSGVATNETWEYNVFQDVWTQKANFGGTARFGAVATSVNNKGYVGLGHNGISFEIDIWEYNPSSNNWTAKANFVGIGRYTAAVNINNKIYTGLGQGAIIYNDWYEYNPSSNIWTQKANFGGGPRRAPFIVSSNNKIFAGLGQDGTTFKSDIWEYNITLDSWSQKNDFPGNQREVYQSMAIDNKAYLIGGELQSGLNENDNWEYDITKDLWNRKNNIPVAGRRLHSVFSLNNKGYFALGAGGLQDFYEYTPSTLPSFYITSAVSSITSSGGIVSAVTDANFNGCATNSITSKGIILGTSNSFTLSNASFTFTSGSGNSNFSSTLSGLSPATTYYARAFSTSAAGSNYGNAVSFTTIADLPTITTTAISNLTSVGVESGGVITSDGGATVTARGVVWGTNPNPTVALATKTSDASGTGTYSSTATGLTPGTVYYLRAYATNSAGTAYGSEATFTTLNIPSLTTVVPDDITGTNAQSGGEITSDGNDPITAKGVVWSTSPNPTVALATKTNDGAGISNFSSVISGLTYNTDYYVRAYATNSTGTAYGQEEFFTSNASSVVLLNEVYLTGERGFSFTATATDDGGQPITERGVVWGTTRNPRTNNEKKTFGDGLGLFRGTVLDLLPETKYYVRTYLVNTDGISYSSNKIIYTADQDAVPTATELNAPNNGDGNGDGIPDYAQRNVVTINSSNGNLVTIASTDPTKEILVPLAMKSLERNPNYEYPHGMYSFNINASSATITMYFHGITNLSNAVYRKSTASGLFYNYPFVTFSSLMIGNTRVATATLVLTDGAFGDSDGIVNGVISDPGGPAIPVAAVSNIPTISEWARILLISLIVILGIWKIRKYV